MPWEGVLLFCFLWCVVSVYRRCRRGVLCRYVLMRMVDLPAVLIPPSHRRQGEVVGKQDEHIGSRFADYLNLHCVDCCSLTRCRRCRITYT